MDRPLTRDDLLEVLESTLSAQLRAVRASRCGRGSATRRSGRDGKKSNISIVKDILTTSGQPLHINDILSRARHDHGVDLKRESIVSALTKKVLDGNTFCRAGRNVFGLLGKEQG